MATFQFHGTENFAVPRQQLWQFLTDLRNVGRCLPNFSDAKFPNPDTLTGKLGSSFTFARGTFDVTIEFRERRPQDSARALVTATGLGCQAVIDSSLRLTETGPQETALEWSATVELGGLLSFVSKGLIEGAARKIIADSFDAVRREIARSRPA
jgi:carbon monoxide dehydrogenase subunit G